MTDNVLSLALSKLTAMQLRAAEWRAGALLVLAGPGSGKTQVLTCRIAGLLDASRDKNFRVLALTFTNKAADEMKARVAAFVPGLEERANIGTFHSFCAQVLRQHGVHLGIKPDFAIYSLDKDREAVLEAALQTAIAAGQPVKADFVRYLSIIDRLKSLLIEPRNAEKALSHLQDRNSILLTYELYEQELRRLNALDFNSLILEVHRLAVEFPAIAGRYRKSHPYWMLDEFQDTNSAQYRLIKALAGESFKNLFAVADDDQIIYQWNGASFRHIQEYRAEFAAELIQLSTNYRCPPAIVAAANKLVAYNVQRTSAKEPLLAGKTTLKLPAEQHIQVRHFASEDDEAQQTAVEIAGLGKEQWSNTTVLARNRSLLERMHAALHNAGVASQIAQRRDDFLSAQFRWFVACLTQISRPIDKRNFAILVQAFNRMASIELSVDTLLADAEATGRSYLETWHIAAADMALATPLSELLELISVSNKANSAKTALDRIPAEFEKLASSDDGASDLAEDAAAWREITRDITRHIGKGAPLDQFLQELQLRSKEASPKPDSVTLMTVHGAKGREFDNVYVIGLAEDVLPSFQSKQKGDASAEMEEERRNCFVAITRTKERLVLSRADKYRNWTKAPSRFLVEMGLAA